LHGDEKPSDVENYPIPVIKSFRVGQGFDVSRLAQYRSSAYLLDTFVDGKHGGTGKTFDWGIGLKSKSFGRVIISGGLTPENVGLAIRTVRPFGVDVNSGVEAAPGLKDREKLRRFFAAARAAEFEREP
jgi:phosphoribosylanthranilate isomerase